MGKREVSVPGTVNSTSDYTLWTLYRSYFKGGSANIKLQMYGGRAFGRTLDH
jgi:hypothetical protein